MFKRKKPGDAFKKTKEKSRIPSQTIPGLQSIPFKKIEEIHNGIYKQYLKNNKRQNTINPNLKKKLEKINDTGKKKIYNNINKIYELESKKPKNQLEAKKIKEKINSLKIENINIIQKAIQKTAKHTKIQTQKDLKNQKVRRGKTILRKINTLTKSLNFTLNERDLVILADVYTSYLNKNNKVFLKESKKDPREELNKFDARNILNETRQITKRERE